MNSEQPAILELSHLTKAYKDLIALDDVSLQVGRATVHAIVGEAGAGKTTLMKILGGILREDDYAGEVLFDGQPIRPKSPADALRRGIAIVPRKLAVIENCSVADNIEMASWQLRRSFWVSRTKEAERSQALLHQWSIEIDPAASVRDLTPLQKRMLMICRGLAVDPKLIVLDEPLSSVPGSQAMAQMVRFVHRIPEHGVTCLYLTRRPQEAMMMASFLTVLRDGEVMGTWRGPEFDEAAIEAALPGTRADIVNPAADDFSDNGGMFGPLREYFDRMMRPGG